MSNFKIRNDKQKFNVFTQYYMKKQILLETKKTQVQKRKIDN